MPRKKKSAPEAPVMDEITTEDIDSMTGELDLSGLMEDLSPEEREQILNAPDAPDDSIDKAKFNNDLAREWASTAELYRDEPEEFKGQRTKGYIRKFSAPFNVEEIRDWAANFRGGGKYKILCYDGGHILRTRSTFFVEGDPLLPAEIEAAEGRVRREEREEEGGRKAESIAMEYERRLAAERMERFQSEMRSEMRGQEDRMMRILEKLAEKDSEPKRNPAQDWAPLLAAVAPVLQEFARREPPPPPKDNFGEMMMFMSQMSTENRKLMQDLAADASSKKDHMDPIVKALVSKALGVGKDDPMKTYNTVMEKMLPGLIGKMTDFALKSAGKGGDDDDGSITPKYIAEKIGDIAKPLIEKAGGMAGAPQAPPPGAIPYGGYPMPPGAPHMAPMPQAPPVPRHPGAIQGDVFQGSPGVVVPPPAPPGTVPPPAEELTSPPTPGQLPAAPDSVIEQPLPTEPQPGAEIHPQVFERGIHAMQHGMDGSDFAHWCEENNENNVLLSDAVIEAMEAMPPGFCVPQFMNQLGSMAPNLVPYFNNPQGGAFVTQFCTFFYDSDEEGAEEPEVKDPVEEALEEIETKEEPDEAPNEAEKPAGDTHEEPQAD